ncbi:DUF881 domain-containing protein [uncultured Pseudokineococcus sp.]|uniref:DUF881 domain-containing protein n=1 Tax=uncultured Pseudokineococcus sp. TaxID=1642928 RepID=UPI00262DD4A6|nr:DUF881 domain-containing protein [uncultured Pseudokineococcus sp.]
MSTPEEEPGPRPEQERHEHGRHAGPGPGEDPAAEGEQGPPAPPSARLVRRRLVSALRPRAARGQLLAGLLCAALGFALVVQLQATQESGLAQLREADLVRAVDDLGEQRQRLQGELTELRDTQRALQAEGDQRAEALRSQQDAEDAQRLLAGTAPAVGPGVTVSVVDPDGGVSAVRLLGTVQELRDAGAEVLSVGDARVGARTAFTDTALGVEVGGTLVTSPFTIRAIGDPVRLEATIGIPGGVLDLLESEGATVLVQRRDEVRITATAPEPAPGLARPDDAAGEGTGGDGGDAGDD